MALPISISMGWWVHFLLGMLVNYQEKKNPFLFINS